MKKQTKVIIYTTAKCAHCRQAKAFLENKKVRFLDLDIQRNQRAFKEFQRLGSRGVPVIIVGSSRIDGFDPRKLEEVLRKYGLLDKS